VQAEIAMRRMAIMPISARPPLVGLLGIWSIVASNQMQQLLYGLKILKIKEKTR
jgi:hypothetical protein